VRRQKADCSLGHRVYWKPPPPHPHTRTNLYLHATSHHPSNKQSPLSTLVQRARVLCDSTSLHYEPQFLRDAFRRNGYGARQMQRLSFHRPPPKMPASVSFLLFVSTTFSLTSQMLSGHNIKSVDLCLPREIPSFHWLVKDYPGLKTPGVHSILCERGEA
jgi:hypothetical protein